MHTYAHIRYFLKSSRILHKLKWVRDVACVTGKLHAQLKREKLRLSRIENQICQKRWWGKGRWIQRFSRHTKAKKSLTLWVKRPGGRKTRGKSPGAIHLWTDLRKREGLNLCTTDLWTHIQVADGFDQLWVIAMAADWGTWSGTRREKASRNVNSRGCGEAPLPLKQRVCQKDEAGSSRRSDACGYVQGGREGRNRRKKRGKRKGEEMRSGKCRAEWRIRRVNKCPKVPCSSDFYRVNLGWWLHLCAVLWI